MSEPIIGQAIHEGILLRKGDKFVLARRRPDGEIEVKSGRTPLLTSQHPWLRSPGVRGVAAVAEAVRGATWATSQEGTKGLLSLVGSLMGGMALYLLPDQISRLTGLRNRSPLLSAFVEGVGRLGGIALYLLLSARSPQIRRLFQYHGAEHKAVNAFEKLRSTSIKAMRRASRLHARCGSIFAALLALTSSLASLGSEGKGFLRRLVEETAKTFLLIGLVYELARWAARSRSPLAKAVLAPGFLLQLAATKEPDDDQLEVAQKALEALLEEA